MFNVFYIDVRNLWRTEEKKNGLREAIERGGKKNGRRESHIEAVAPPKMLLYWQIHFCNGLESNDQFHHRNEITSLWRGRISLINLINQGGVPKTHSSCRLLLHIFNSNNSASWQALRRSPGPSGWLGFHESHNIQPSSRQATPSLLSGKVSKT